MNYNLPDGYYWKSGKGLIKVHGQREEVICDCVPVDIKRHKLIFERTQEERDSYSFYLLDAEGKMMGVNGKPFVCMKEDLVSFKFINIISSDIIFEPKNGVREEARRVFEYVIKKSCKNQTPDYSYQYEFGWNGKIFCWMKETQITKGKEYVNANHICELLTNIYQIPAAVLASEHGILEKLIQDAGMHHNFVTYFAGTTGIGKSALLRAVCDYHTKTGNLITVGADHKSIKKVLENRCDMTIVLDDFCKTKSERVSSSQLQIVSEVIQVSSDAARLLVDEDSVDRVGGQGRHHVVVSAEQMVNNESTINRRFLVYFTDTLSEKKRED